MEQQVNQPVYALQCTQEQAGPQVAHDALKDNTKKMQVITHVRAAHKSRTIVIIIQTPTTTMRREMSYQEG
jgi:hypothetical protein